MAQFTEQLDKIRAVIHKNEVVKKYADMIEEKTKIHIEYFVVALGVIPLIMAYYGYFGKTLGQLIGYVYPFYASILSIEKKETGIWLTYWVVYSLFGVVEDFVDAFFFWFQYYYTLKIALLVWLFLPQTLGAKIVYEKGILPVFNAIEGPVSELFGTN